MSFFCYGLLPVFVYGESNADPRRSKQVAVAKMYYSVVVF